MFTLVKTFTDYTPIFPPVHSPLPIASSLSMQLHLSVAFKPVVSQCNQETNDFKEDNRSSKIIVQRIFLLLFACPSQHLATFTLMSPLLKSCNIFASRLFRIFSNSSDIVDNWELNLPQSAQLQRRIKGQAFDLKEQNVLRNQMHKFWKTLELNLFKFPLRQKTIYLQDRVVWAN